jgi:hypothetical protein
MYIQASEGLGQARDWLLSEGVRKGRHVREKWSQCGREGPRQRRCGLILGVPFRQSYEEFRREVERALANWMTPKRAAEVVKKRQENLKAFHRESLASKFPNDTVLAVVGTLTYRGPTNGQWRVVDGDLH